MRRRPFILAAAAALYVALMAVTWSVGTRQAAQKTEAQLDYAILDFRSTIGGAIDTMLGYVAGAIVRELHSPRSLTLAETADLADRYDMDEVNVVSRDGVIIASNDPHCIGRSMRDGAKTAEFLVLTNGVTETVSQQFRAGVHNPGVRRKYLGIAFPGGDGFVQVGLDERHLATMLPTMLGYIFDEWLLGRTGFFLCADAATDRLISNPVRHRDEATSLSGAGFDYEAAKPYEIRDEETVGETFVQRLFGEKCYCRSYVFGGHRFVPALPEHEYYDTRSAYFTVLGVLLFFLLAAFAWLLDRVLADSDRLRSFYAAEDERRAKDLLLANTIQTAALPNVQPESDCFKLFASMSAAREVGGDFYDYFPLDQTHYAFLVADVSGKGVTAALYMMTAKTILKDILLDEKDPAAALTKANAELCANNAANMFLTAWAGVLDFTTGEVVYANAGHNPPLAVRAADGSVSYERDVSGPVLAFMDGVVYKPRSLFLSPGDWLFLYTDGVTEALDEKGALYGEDRLAAVLRDAARLDPEPVCRAVVDSVSVFAGLAPQADDITVMAMKYTSRPESSARMFRPTTAGLAESAAYLDEKLAQFGFTDCPEAAQLSIILDEIASNVVRHSGAKMFELDIEKTDTPPGVTLVLADDGVAYDPLTHADPDTTLSAEERPIGGLGILMVKKMSNSITYTRANDRNVLSVYKQIASV